MCASLKEADKGHRAPLYRCKCIVLLDQAQQTSTTMKLTKAVVLLLALLSLTSAGLQIMKSELTGGSGGTPWDDDVLEHSPTIVGVRSVTVGHVRRFIANIQVTYLLADNSTYTAKKHGGTPHLYYRSPTIILENDERIVRVEGKVNGFSRGLVNQMTLITENADGVIRQHGPYGRGGKTAFSVEGYVVGFHGSSGSLTDALGFFYLPAVKKSRKFGGSGGTAFTDPVETIIPPIVRIRQIRVCADHSHITSINTDYYQLGGGTYYGETHSGNGECQTFKFDAEEEITTFSGVHDTQVQYLVFSTDDRPVVGPLGSPGELEVREDVFFGLRANIIGFFGHSSSHLDAVGVFYV